MGLNYFERMWSWSHLKKSQWSSCLWFSRNLTETDFKQIRMNEVQTNAFAQFPLESGADLMRHLKTFTQKRLTVQKLKMIRLL